MSQQRRIADAPVAQRIGNYIALVVSHEQLAESERREAEERTRAGRGARSQDRRGARRGAVEATESERACDRGHEPRPVQSGGTRVVSRRLVLPLAAAILSEGRLIASEHVALPKERTTP